MIKLNNIFINSHSRLLQLSLLEFVFWATFSSYYPFLVVYLVSKGIDNTTIGIIMSVNSFVLILSQPFWGYASDRLRSIKRVFLFCLITATILWLALPIFESVLLIGLMLAVLTFFESPLSPLLDSWVVQGIKEEKVNSYGNIRMWGSLGFAMISYINGRLIGSYGITSIFYSFAILALLTVLLLTLFRSKDVIVSRHTGSLGVSGLLKNYYYFAFVVFAAVLFIPHRSAYTFLPRLVEHLGGRSQDFGMAISILALSEVPLLIFSGFLLRRFKPIHLILVSTFFFTLRQILLLFATQPIHAILIQTLQGPSFTLFLPGAVYYIDSLTPDKLKSTAQTLASASFLGVSGLVGCYGGGWLIDHYGIMRLYSIGAVISLCISILFLLSFPLGKLIVKSPNLTEDLHHLK